MGFEVQQEYSSTVIVRPYKHSDQKQILQILVQGTVEGEYSPLPMGLAFYRPFTWGAASLSVIALLLSLLWHQVQVSGSATPFALSPTAINSLLLTLYLTCIGLFLYGHLGERGVRALAVTYLSACSEDLSDVVSAFGLDPPLKTPYCLPNGPGGFWVAEKDGNVVGYVGLKVTKNSILPKVGEVCRLLVAGDHRGQGIGGVLMKALYLHARQHGLEKLELMSSWKYNTPACLLYERHGFTQIGEVWYEGHKFQRFKKNL